MFTHLYVLTIGEGFCKHFARAARAESSFCEAFLLDINYQMYQLSKAKQKKKKSSTIKQTFKFQWPISPFKVFKILNKMMNIQNPNRLLNKIFINMSLIMQPKEEKKTCSMIIEDLLHFFLSVKMILIKQLAYAYTLATTLR